MRARRRTGRNRVAVGALGGMMTQGSGLATATLGLKTQRRWRWKMRPETRDQRPESEKRRSRMPTEGTRPPVDARE